MAPDEFRVYVRRRPFFILYGVFASALFAVLLVLLVVNHDAVVSSWADAQSSSPREHWGSEHSRELVLLTEAFLAYLTVQMVLGTLLRVGRIPLVIATDLHGPTATVRMPLSRPFLLSKSLVLSRDEEIDIAFVRRYKRNELSITSGRTTIVRRLNDQIDVDRGDLFVEWLKSRGYVARGVGFVTTTPPD